MTTVDQFLEHYGIRGMKWGVRRSASQLSRSPESSGSSGSRPAWQSPPPGRKKGSSSSSATVSTDQLIYEALKARAKTNGVNTLSNDEIRILTTRAETLKKAYATFPKPQTKRQRFRKRAGKVVEDVLVNTGQQVLKEVVKNKLQVAARDRDLLPKKNESVEALRKAAQAVAEEEKR